MKGRGIKYLWSGRDVAIGMRPSIGSQSSLSSAGIGIRPVVIGEKNFSKHWCG